MRNNDDDLQPLITDQPLPAGQDYAALRAEGLQHLQRLSGQVWTDYNDHDPGVTLLEALCFVLTDVSYRAALPMADLLAGPPRSQPQNRPDNRLLVPPHQAFANHPVTLQDYKKLLLDRFYEHVENAWVSQLPRGIGQRHALPGHYQVALELYPEPPGDASPLGAPERARLLDKVQVMLNQHRNLGEVFGPPVLLRLHPVVVGGRFDLGPGQNAIAAMAELLYELSEVIDPSLETLMAREALRRGVPVEDIFSGPHAQNQLYVESTFQPQTKRVTLGALLRKASSPTGRYQVIDLYFYDGAPGAEPTNKEQLVFEEDEVGSLDVAESLRNLMMTRQGAPVAVDQDLVLRAYRKLVRAANRRRQGEGGPGQLRLPRPVGRAADLGRYASVQRLLPPLYGIGEEGPPPGTSALARGHIMQLKGYLLLFDQLMADFCAQLAHVGDFFSIVPQVDTYYSGLLYEVPHVAPLLPGTRISPDASWNWEANQKASYRATEDWEKYQERPGNPYRRTLAALAAGNGPSLARRREFLTHLLARFGYTVRLRSERHDSALDEDKAIITGYEQLLAQLDQATYHRAAAWVPLPSPAGQPTHAESGLELFLFLLAGVESLARKWARGERLVVLEQQVQLGTQPNPATPPRLVVRGPAHHFTRVLDVLAGQRRAPALLPLGPDTLRLTVDAAQPTDTWEVTLAGAPPAPGGAPGIDSAARRLLAYAAELDRQLERVCLIDHMVLEPLAARASKGRVIPDEFYHCQATLLLPGYAYRYRTEPGPDGVRRPSGNRVTLEHLIRQHAPAHVLVNMLWLDYPQMLEWERLYAALAETSDLIRPDGQPERVTLDAAQNRARAFLEAHLSASSPPAS